MFALASLFLVLTAFALHHFERHPQQLERGRVLVWAFALVWMPILLEALLGYWRKGDFSWPASGRLLLIWLLPPYRLALSTHPGDDCVWLPVLGWQRIDTGLCERLERAFSLPMLFIALLILPILAVEMFWAEQVHAFPELGLALDLGVALIWLAFTVEFILMSTLADKKLGYLLRHWINLAIILLPFLAFLRGYQVVRLLRLGKLSRALKVYRLRGLGMRAWQGLITLELVERVWLRDPHKRLAHYRARLAEQERELARIRRRIEQLERHIAAPDGDADEPAEPEPGAPGRTAAKRFGTP
jgi:hypothetical protein